MVAGREEQAVHAARVQAEARRAVLRDPMSRSREHLVERAVVRYLLQEGR